MKTIWAIHGKTLRDKIRSDHLRHLSGIQGIIKWTEVRKTEWDAHVGRMEDVWQRSLETVVHRECAVEADRRNAGKKVSSKPLPLNLWKNRR